MGSYFAGIIKKGGERPNIVPAYTELEFYLRTPRWKELPLLIEKAESCLKAAAQATGCRVRGFAGGIGFLNFHPTVFVIL